MSQLPSPLRAAVGLIATIADDAPGFPDKAIELPMLAVSAALQISLRAQQQYAQLVARGDEVLNRVEPTDEPPAWASFDPPVADTGLTDAVAAAAEPDDAEQAGAVPDADDTTVPGKRIRRPRSGPPSAFDVVDDSSDGAAENG